MRTRKKEVPQPPSPKREWSARSQASVKRQWELERQLKNCQQQLAGHERKLANGIEAKRRQTRQLSAGQGIAHRLLQETVSEIRQEEDCISSFKQHEAALRREIKSLDPTPAQVKERAARQELLAGLAEERMLKAVEADLLLKSLRRVLLEYTEFTGRMTEVAYALEFARPARLDSDRFERLLCALPDNLAESSKEWITWFFSAEDERVPYSVTGGEFVLPETLRNANAFRTGDCSLLTAKEAKTLDLENARRVVPQPDAGIRPGMPRRLELSESELPERLTWLR